MKPAKYIKVEYGEDPLVYGMIDGDHHQYVELFQATPFPSTGPLCTYTSGQLEFFEDDHDLRPKVDSAVYHLYDKTALAEVECYRINKKKLKREYEELRQVQHDIWKRELTLGGCARRLAGAHVYQRIEVVNRARLRILMDEYKARHHCHGSGRDACPQGRPGVARPSDTSAKNIGRKECRESRRKNMDRSDGSDREYRRIGRTHQITCRLEISVLITGLDMIG